MKRLALVLALGLTGTALALAQPAPGTAAPAPSTGATPYTSATPPPKLDAAQSAEVQRQLSLYRTEIDGRVGRGEITAAEAGRLLQWREWQIAQQVAGLAPPPGPIVDELPATVVREYSPRPYYAYPYYGPAYYPAPAPYYWGASICAGGWGHHGGARFCF